MKLHEKYLTEKVSFDDMKDLVIRFWRLTSDRKNHQGVDDLMKYARDWKDDKYKYELHKNVAETFKAFANAVEKWDYHFMKK